ncbi:response regulator transcription factor [Elusimicrobiota bacterium]
MSRTSVLVVEDDLEVQDLYKQFFRVHQEEFLWTLVTSGEQALREMKRHSQTPIDVALIDWRLNHGNLDGLQVLRYIRSDPATRHMLAFMVTANETELDMRTAFAAGADDYILKPFREWELLARLHNRLDRRDQSEDDHQVFELDGLRLDVQSRHVTLNGKLVELYRTEFALLKVFLEKRDRVLSQEHLWQEVRGYASKTAGNALMQQMKNLRKKLGAWGDRIETCRGEGYLLNTRFPVSP